jgi:hypothetical protein
MVLFALILTISGDLPLINSASFISLTLAWIWISKHQSTNRINLESSVESTAVAEYTESPAFSRYFKRTPGVTTRLLNTRKKYLIFSALDALATTQLKIPG